MSQTQTCPLCHAPAIYAHLGLQSKHFKCPSCGEFVLFAEAEKWLQHHAATTPQHYAKFVRANQGHDTIYVISGRLPDSLPHDEIVGQPLPRSEALSGQ